MPEPAPASTVYYDGACPICSREVALYRARPGAERLDWVDVSACPAEALGPGLTRKAALARMHVRDAGGGLVSGAAAFAAIWRALPGLAPLGRVLALPVVAPAAELAYRLFLRVRRVWRH
jgi:predicted DCC family thiol-disulfide oxidoreductase YuxK